jgi:hypothetical protein
MILDGSTKHTAVRHAAACALALLSAALHVACGAAPEPDRSDVALPRPALRAVSTVDASGASPRSAGRRVGPPAEWPDDPRAAIARGKAEDRPTLVVFYAAWSTACAELAKSLAAPEVQAILDRRFVAARVDVTDDGSRGALEARQAPFDIVGLPTLVVFDATGKEVARALEYLDPAELTVLLEGLP